MSLADYRKNLAQLVAETLLLARDPLGERWGETRAAEAVNDAALEFALETECVKEELNIQVLEDVFIYDIKARAATAGLREYGFPLRVGFEGKTEPAHTPTSMFEMDLMGYDTRIWYRNVLSPNRIAIIPPSADGAAPADPDPYEGNIQVLYAAHPVYMDADADYPDSMISSLFHNVIPYGAAARLLDEGGDLGDFEAAAENEAAFREGIGRAKREAFRGLTEYAGCVPM